MHMSRSLVAFLAAAAAACAPAAQTSGPYTGPATVSRSSSGSTVQLNVAHEASSAVVAQPLARVWEALPGVYADLGLAVGSTDVATRMVAGRTRMRRQSGGPALSRLFECGTTAVGQSVADVYRIDVNIRTSLASAGAGTQVRTLVEASARASDGTSSNEVHCSSTGALEDAIAAALREKTAS